MFDLDHRVTLLRAAKTIQVPRGTWWSVAMAIDQWNRLVCVHANAPAYPNGGREVLGTLIRTNPSGVGFCQLAL